MVASYQEVSQLHYIAPSFFLLNRREVENTVKKKTHRQDKDREIINFYRGQNRIQGENTAHFQLMSSER